jgi:plasmid stability protein
MTRMIQIRNVPADVHRKLKSRAAVEGISLSDYLLKEIRNVAERPTIEELAKRLESRTTVSYRVSPVRILREKRNGR